MFDDIEAAGIDREIRSCNIFDLYEVVRVTAREIQQHADDDVFVNIATGSKISAIGGMIACMVSEADPYYVEPARYGDKDGQRVKPVSHGVKNIKKLPAYPIDAPEKQLVYVMEYIYRNGPVTKKELIEYGQGNGKSIPAGTPPEGLPFIADYEANSDRARYRVLETHVLEPLTDRGFIETKETGRRIDIDLTEEGENTLSAFRHVIEK
jgi:predicted transcriptional regulator